MARGGGKKKTSRGGFLPTYRGLYVPMLEEIISVSQEQQEANRTTNKNTNATVPDRFQSLGSYSNVFCELIRKECAASCLQEWRKGGCFSTFDGSSSSCTSGRGATSSTSSRRDHPKTVSSSSIFPVRVTGCAVGPTTTATAGAGTSKNTNQSVQLSVALDTNSGWSSSFFSLREFQRHCVVAVRGATFGVWIPFVIIQTNSGELRNNSFSANHTNPHHQHHTSTTSSSSSAPTTPTLELELFALLPVLAGGTTSTSSGGGRIWSNGPPTTSDNKNPVQRLLSFTPFDPSHPSLRHLFPPAGQKRSPAQLLEAKMELMRREREHYASGVNRLELKPVADCCLYGRMWEAATMIAGFGGSMTGGGGNGSTSRRLVSAAWQSVVLASTTAKHKVFESSSEEEDEEDDPPSSRARKNLLEAPEVLEGLLSSSSSSRDPPTVAESRALTLTHSSHQKSSASAVPTTAAPAGTLNPSQARAAALCENKLCSQNPVVCIQGPPGTGKTRTIAHISRKIVLGGVGLLVCTASSNKAVQNMLEKFLTELPAGPSANRPRIAYIGVEDKIPNHLRQFFVHTRVEFCRTRAEFDQLRRDAPQWTTRQKFGSYEEFLQKPKNTRTDERLELELLMNADVVFSTLACLGRVKVLNLLRAKADGSRKVCGGAAGTRSSSSYDYEESGAEEVDGIHGEEEVVMGKHLQVFNDNAPVDIGQMVDADSSGEETESTEPLEAGKTDRTTIEALADAISDDELREKLKRNSTLTASSVELKKRKLSAIASHVLVARKQQPPAPEPPQPGTIGPKGKAQNHLTIIVDEAAQAVEAETLITLALQPNRLILVGDPQQLSATVIHSEECRKANYARSLMERLMKIGGSDESGCGGSNDNVSKAPVVMLNVQYRMHPEICSFVSNRFYAGKLETDYNLLRTRGMLGNKNSSTAVSSASIEVVPQHLPHLPPYLIVDHDFSEDEKVSGPRGGTGYKGAGNHFSIRNRGEADLLLRVRKHLRRRFTDEDAIRILTFYNGQRDYLAQKVSVSPAKITQEVHTVDSFQGSEAPVVLLSFTKSGKHGHGFLSEFRRLNVALSRAQHHLIVFANVKGLLSTGARPSKGRRGGVVVDEKNEEDREVELKGAPTTREDNEITALLKDAQRRGCVVSAAELERMLAGVADDPSSPAGGKKKNTKELVGTRRASSQPRGKKKSKTSASTKNKKLCVVAKMKKPEIESGQAKKAIKCETVSAMNMTSSRGKRKELKKIKTHRQR